MSVTQPASRVLIAVATLNRPVLLGHTLNSLATQICPEGVEIEILVVENQEPATVGSIIEALSCPYPLHLITEGRRGLSYARNAALDYAISRNFDWMAFVDDDEEAPPEWIGNLYRGATARDLDLCGGHTIPHNPHERLSPLQKYILRGMASYQAEQRLRFARKVRSGRDKTDSISTANWMCKVSSVSNAGVRFDLRLNASGGEDMQFSTDSLNAGLRLGRILDAGIYDTVHASRLSCSYIFKRERDQEITDFRRHYEFCGTAPHKRKIWPSSCAKYIHGAVSVTLSPLIGPKHLIKGLRKLGRARGRILAARGHRSTHYEATHGH